MLYINSIKATNIMKIFKDYELTVILTEDFKDNEIKSWVFNYAKNLRKFNVRDISVISRGKRKLAYSINDKLKGNYIQLNFSSISKYTIPFLNKLKMDPKVLRFFIIKK